MLQGADHFAILQLKKDLDRCQGCRCPCRAGNIWCSSSIMDGSFSPKYSLVLLAMAFMKDSCRNSGVNFSLLASASLDILHMRRKHLAPARIAHASLL